jgi:two-component system, LytTR family, sensor histidine kinase LytS
MVDLFISLIERLGVFAIIFIFSMRLESVKKLLTGTANRYEKLCLAVVFGLVGIAGTYLGVPIQNAIANSRVVGVAIGGILGGPLVGFGAGIIAGGHRLLIDIGGFTSVACCVATIAEGVVGGVLYNRIKKKPFDPLAALMTGIAVEVLQMLIILVIARPFDAALDLVYLIAVPMIIANSAGLALFVELMASVSREQERVAAFQAQTALKIALRTLPYLRNGLKSQSAAETSRIILEMTDLDAVAITDETRILAHKGVAEDHHRPGMELMTAATKKAMADGSVSVAKTRAEVGCSNPKCPLGSTIIVPLRMGDRMIGALKLYRVKENRITPLDVELANGLAHLFSNQLELAEVENQKKMLKDAEIKALQAQINPHFLFNAINTIVSHIRTSPATASDLLLKLSDFFRMNINPGAENVTLEKELEHCEAYIGIEKARFEDRLKVRREIDIGAMGCKLPPLILQPLVENALKHGILPVESGGEVVISARRVNGSVMVSVKDDGVGMDEEQVRSLFTEGAGQAGPNSRGIGLRNVNARLIALYGRESGLSVESRPGSGATITFMVPLS